MRMIHPAQNIPFSFKLVNMIVVDALSQDQLQGYRYLEVSVGSLGKIDIPHTAAGNFIEDLIGTNLKRLI